LSVNEYRQRIYNTIGDDRKRSSLRQSSSCHVLKAQSISKHPPSHVPGGGDNHHYPKTHSHQSDRLPRYTRTEVERDNNSRSESRAPVHYGHPSNNYPYAASPTRPIRQSTSSVPHYGHSKPTYHPQHHPVRSVSRTRSPSRMVHYHHNPTPPSRSYYPNAARSVSRQPVRVLNDFRG
jgi:hypothetical protein